MIVLPDSENRMIVASFVSTQYQRVTEGRTDGQTDTAMANTVPSAYSKLCRRALKTLNGPRVRRISPVGEEKVYNGKDLPKSRVLSSE